MYNLDFFLPLTSYSQLFTTSCWLYLLNIRTVSQFSSLYHSPCLGSPLLSTGNSNFLTGVLFFWSFPLSFVLSSFPVSPVWTKIWLCVVHVLKTLQSLPVTHRQSWRSSSSWLFHIVFLYPLNWAWCSYNITWLGISSMPYTPSWFLLASLSEILRIHTATQTFFCQNVLVFKIQLRCAPSWVLHPHIQPTADRKYVKKNFQKVP